LTTTEHFFQQPTQNVQLSVVEIPRRLPYFRNIWPQIFPRQNIGHEVLEILRRISIYGELGSLNNKPQQSPVVVVVEWQTTNHLQHINKCNFNCATNLLSVKMHDYCVISY